MHREKRRYLVPTILLVWFGSGRQTSPTSAPLTLSHLVGQGTRWGGYCWGWQERGFPAGSQNPGASLRSSYVDMLLLLSLPAPSLSFFYLRKFWACSGEGDCRGRSQQVGGLAWEWKWTSHTRTRGSEARIRPVLLSGSAGDVRLMVTSFLAYSISSMKWKPQCEEKCATHGAFQKNLCF